MVGRALDRIVERDLDAELTRTRDESLEVGVGAEVGVDRRVPAVLRSDRPRAADVARLRPHCVVPPLPVRMADRMDRRQVEDVEAQLRELRQRTLDTGEAAPGARE